MSWLQKTYDKFPPNHLAAACPSENHVPLGLQACLSAVWKLKGFGVTGIYVREDLSSEEQQKCRKQSGTHKAADIASGGSQGDLHISPQSQSLSSLGQPPS